MSDKKIPEGWVECEAWEATKVLLAGGDHRTVVADGRGRRSVRIDTRFSVPVHLWPLLGIIPIRKAPPPEPIEFVVGTVRQVCEEEHFQFVCVPIRVKPGMRFREVQD